MLTYQECVDMCGLTEEEIDAIAEHEHVDRMFAMALGQYLITHNGEQRIKRIILDDIQSAERKGDEHRVEVLQKVLQHFIVTHKGHKTAAH